MKILGILLLVVSVGLLIFAWVGPQPGGRTLEQVMENGAWKTVKDIDHSRPIRWTYSGVAAVMFVLGAGVVVFSRRLGGGKRALPKAPADED